VVNLTLVSPVNQGEAVQVRYTDPTEGNDAQAVQDLAGNDATSFGDTVVNNLTGGGGGGGDTAPTLISSSVNGDQLTLTFSADLDAFNLPNASAYSVLVNGTDQNPVFDESVVGSTITFTLTTAVQSGDEVSFSYADPTPGTDDANALQHLVSGIDVESFNIASVNNTTSGGGGGETDTAAPVLQSVVYHSSNHQLVLTFNENMELNLPAPEVWTLNGQPLDVTSGTVTGSTLVLVLGAGQVVNIGDTLGYTDPTSGDDPQAVQDVAGNDLADVSMAVAAPSGGGGGDTTPPQLAATNFGHQW
jgi:uncharacterized repeat protein (TIGR02059 family)